jgi:two-component system chemotaxis sensor kinase CheA
MDIKKYLEMYLSEGREHLSALTKGLQFKEGFNPESVSELFRGAHSLKGMAASMGFETTSKLAHALENILAEWRKGSTPSEEEIRRALRATDLLEALFEKVEKEGNDGGMESDVEQWFNEGSKKEERKDGIKQKSESAEKPKKSKEKGFKIKVKIDPSSNLPAARLLIVYQKIKSMASDVEIVPAIEEIQREGTKFAEFYLEDEKDIKEIARAVASLPEVVDVELAEEEAGEASSSSALVSSLKIPSKSLDNFLYRISHLIYHLNILEKNLPLEVLKRQKFWFESHRSGLYQLYNEILETRLVSFDTLIERLERGARDLCAKTSKKFKFVVEGGGEKIDKVLLEKLLDPLMHLLRNSADHGIEENEQRVKLGKPSEGTIKMAIKRDGEKLTISFSDDGKGLDFEAIKESALKRGLIPFEKANSLNESDILDLITIPSFSTKKEVTQISGRGVGLDVVRSSVESLGGTLEMESKKGRGTTFYLIFPSAVTLTEVVVFSWDDNFYFALPTSQVNKLYPLSEYPIEWIEGSKRLRVEDKFYDILNFRLKAVGKEGIGIALNISPEQKILLVNKVLQTEKVVILPLGKPLERIPNLIGGALLSFGEICYIFDGTSFARNETEAMNVFQIK